MDGYSRAWLESRSGREAMAAKRRADERAQNRAKQYRKFWQLADEKARLLEFDPTKLSSTMFLSYMDYDRFSFPSDMFPNAEEIFPDWDSRIVKLTIYDSDYAEETQNVFNATEEEKDLKEAAFKRRVSHYFYEDVKDFDKEGVLDLFINYLKYSKDFDLKKMGSSSALSDEHIKEIIARSHPVYCNMMQLDLLLERPHVFSKEQVEEIVLQQWLVGSYDRYREMSMPTHMGMSPEDVEFRQKLNHVYQEIVGKSIYDLNFSGKSYFDMLLMKQQIDELIAEHREQFTDYMKKTLDFQLLMNKLKEDDNKNLADTPLNHQIIEFLDSIVTKENEHLLLSPNVSPLYVRHRILNHSLQDQNVIKQLAVYTFRDEIAVLLNRADSLDKETLKNVYQAAWLYARGNKSPDVLKSEYQALFGEDLENVKETWEGKYPLGASRFDILMKSKNVEILSQYHLDEFLQQPIDEIFQVIKDCHIYLHGYLNITDSSKNAFRLLDACVDKFGWKLISENGPTQSLSEILIARYVAGKRIPEEIEALRSFNIRYSDLEELFEQNGDTLYQMKDLEFLITYDKKDKIDIINKRNEHFDNDDEKYKAFNQAVNAWASLNKDKQAEYFPYVRDFAKKSEINGQKIRSCMMLIPNLA